MNLFPSLYAWRTFLVLLLYLSIKQTLKIWFTSSISLSISTLLVLISIFDKNSFTFPSTFINNSLSKNWVYFLYLTRSLSFAFRFISAKLPIITSSLYNSFSAISNVSWYILNSLISFACSICDLIMFNLGISLPFKFSL